MSDESPHNAVPDSSAVESKAPDVSSSKASAEVREAIASDACGAVSAENSPAQEEVADTACATDAAGGPVVAEIVAAQADDQVPPLACNSVWSAIGWCLGLLAIQFVLGMHLGALFAPMRKLPGAVVVFALNGICVLVSAAIMVHRVYPGAVRRVLAWRMPPLFHVALVVLAVAPNLLFYSACEEAFARLTRQTSMAPVSGLCSWHPLPLAAGPHSSPFSLLDEQFMELARESWMAILLLGCLLPAVGEELFFRGFLGRGLVARYGLVRGIALTSLAFGLFHLAPQRIGFATFLGVSLHLVYVVSKSLLAPMLLHLLNNLLALSVSRWAQDGSWNPTMGSEEAYFPWSLSLAALAAVVMLLGAAYRGRVRWELPDGQAWTPGFLTAEMPPRGISAVPRRARIGMMFGLTTAGAVLVFGILLACTVPVWTALTRANRALDFAGGQDLPRAMAEADRAGASAPDHPWVRTCQGWVRLWAGKQEQAIDHFDAAIRLAPRSASAHAGRAWARVDLQEYATALADAERAIRLDPRLASAHSARAAAFVSLGRNAEAIEAANRAILLDAQDAVPFDNRGSAHLQLGQHDQAIADLSEAIRLSPHDAFAFRWRAAAHLAKQDYQKAVADATEAIRLEPDELTAYALRGRAQAELGSDQAAIDDFSRVLRGDPQNTEAYLRRGKLLMRRRTPAEAVADFSELVRLCADDPEAYALRASAYAAAGDAARSQADLRKADQLRFAAHLAAAQALGARYQYEQALTELNQALSLDDRNPEPYLQRAEVLTALKRTPDAIADYGSASRLDPDNVDIYLGRGQLYLNSGEYLKALADFDRVLRLWPDHASGYYWRAQVYRKLGREAEAAEDERRLGVQPETASKEPSP